MKNLLILAGGILGCISLFSQTGTSGNPFTHLGHAWHVPSSGTYHFSIGGTSFSTYVEAGSGWILVASGRANTTETGYSITSSLTLQSDRILPAAAYSSATINAVRVNATGGPTAGFDVQSTNATVLSNFRNNVTLSAGANSATWSGSTNDVNRMVPTCGSASGSLDRRIYHAGCIETGLHWMMQDNYENVNYSSAPTRDDLNLWMRASAVSPLPVGWSFVEAEMKPDLTAEVRWGTEFEVNNDFFSVERSADAVVWEEIARISGTNKSGPQNYSSTDSAPGSGRVYYRIRQTDFDGLTTTSEVRELLLPVSRPPTLGLFPNPARSQISFAAEQVPVQWRVLSLYGQDFSAQVHLSAPRQGMVQADVQALPPGWYFLVTDGHSEVFLKE